MFQKQWMPILKLMHVPKKVLKGKFKQHLTSTVSASDHDTGNDYNCISARQSLSIDAKT